MPLEKNSGQAQYETDINGHYRIFHTILYNKLSGYG